MRLLTLDRALRFRFAEKEGKETAADSIVRIPPGVPYLFTDDLANQLHNTEHGRHVVDDRPASELWRPYRGEPLDGKRLFVWRSGGLGDLLFISPLLAELKRRHPTCEIVFGSLPKNLPVLLNNPHVDDLVAPPVPRSYLERFDYHLEFEGTIETSKDAALHAVDLFANHAGVSIADDANKLPVYVVGQQERLRAHRAIKAAKLKPNKRPLIVAQAAASVILRSYPPQHMGEVFRALTGANCDVAVVGGASQFDPAWIMPGVVNFCGRFANVREAVALLSKAAAFIGPDSSFVHFAAALGIPTVALYGPFPGAVRTAFYPKCVTLEADAAICPHFPCMAHSPAPCRLAQEMKQTASPCLEAIAPATVAAAAFQILA